MREGVVACTVSFRYSARRRKKIWHKKYRSTRRETTRDDGWKRAQAYNSPLNLRPYLNEILEVGDLALLPATSEV